MIFSTAFQYTHVNIIRLPLSQGGQALPAFYNGSLHCMSGEGGRDLDKAGSPGLNATPRSIIFSSPGIFPG